MHYMMVPAAVLASPGRPGSQDVPADDFNSMAGSAKCRRTESVGQP
jgi:hypothetical protein